MGSILAFIAVQDGAVKRASYEVLTLARQLGQATGKELAAVVLAAPDFQGHDAIGEYGVPRVYVIADDAFARHRNECVIEGLRHAIDHIKPDLVLLPSTESVKDILGALSVRTDYAAVPDASSVELDDHGVIARRPVMSARFLEETRAKLPALVSVRAGAVTADPAARVEVEMTRLEWSYDLVSARSEVQDVAETIAGVTDLTDARVVIAAGRGVRDEEGRQLVEQLAEVFGGAIGSSRAAVDSGLFEATTQIGQTGKVVSPELYFAVGISGAIQHAAGMQNSRIVVAVNKDPDAPIFQYATYGIVGDLYDVLPRLIDQLKQATN